MLALIYVNCNDEFANFKPLVTLRYSLVNFNLKLTEIAIVCMANSLNFFSCDVAKVNSIKLVCDIDFA